MVSNASEDFPEPDRPVITTRRSRGRSTSMFLRLWTRAPRTAIQSCAMSKRADFLMIPNQELYHARSTLGLCSQTAATEAVGEIKDEAERQPDAEAFPRMSGQTGHDVDAGRRTDQCDRPHERYPEWSWARGILVAQNQDADADDREGGQR